MTEEVEVSKNEASESEQEVAKKVTNVKRKKTIAGDKPDSQ